MAYQWGISAIWFSLGCASACLVLGVWFAKPLRSAKLVTLPQFLEGHFGGRTALLVALSGADGTAPQAIGPARVVVVRWW